jgi:bifunctional DNA-binding transcriptional regulator/antitoxin component of YhaV-PrlF toxin-antitoxin module
MKLLGTSKLSKGSKTTIIKAVLKKLNLKEGDLIVYYEEDDKILIRKG